MIRERVRAWERAAPELEREREERLRRTDTVAAIRSFAGLALASLRARPPEPTSGLVEQQRWLQRLAGRGDG